ncbi:hypothetical protein Tco_1440974 [Tanacetum coccineum]
MPLKQSQNQLPLKHHQYQIHLYKPPPLLKHQLQFLRLHPLVEVFKAYSILDRLVVGLTKGAYETSGRKSKQKGMVVKTRREWRNNTVLTLWRWKFKSGGFGRGRGGGRGSGKSRDGNERVQRDAMLHYKKNHL